MSSTNIANLSYMSREELASTLLAEPATAHPAIVDVRDSDHIGGHIRGSTWVPSSTLDYKTPELTRTLRDKEVVVFHCALSQQRGPAAALRYLREKERLDGISGKKREKDVEGIADKRGEGNEGQGSKTEIEKEQKVYVLRGGFTEWQEKYGEDKNLTEGYQKDVWEFGN